MTSSLNKFGIIALTLLLVVSATIFFLKEEVPTLYINEFMANNTSCCPDTSSGRDEFDDWIEIYNPGKEAINLGGMYVSQDKENPLGYQIPKTDSIKTTIAPGGYLILWADGNPEQGILHLKFKLNQQGEYFGFFYEDGRKIDEIKFDRQEENVSLGRTSDGATRWKNFRVPTPGKSNL